MGGERVLLDERGCGVYIPHNHDIERRDIENTICSQIVSMRLPIHPCVHVCVYFIIYCFPVNARAFTKPTTYPPCAPVDWLS